MVDSQKNLKPGWKIWRFDQIAINVNERIDDPSKSGVDYYVGLEHLDPDSLKIRRWGSPADVEATKLCFKKGDIIFARRRAYQRKLGVAEFDGICSAHAMVLRPRTDVVLPEFLPFFMQSDIFMKRAVEISVGSLSPTINWKTMAVQQFSLPPLAEQKKMAELLETLENLRVAVGDAFDQAWRLRLSMYASLTCQKDFNSAPKEWDRSTIGDALKICNNFRKPISSDIRSAMQGTYPYYGPTGQFDSINEFRLDGTFALIGEDGDHFLKYNTWSMTQLISGKFNVNNHAHVLCGTEKCCTEWFFHFYRHRDIWEYLTKQGSGRLKLNKATLEKMPILVPSIQQQRSIVGALEQCCQSTDAIAKRMKDVSQLLAAMRNKLLGGEIV